MNIASLACPRCGRKLAPMANGGTLYLRCENDSPKCGVIWPAETARCAEVEKRVQQNGSQLAARFLEEAAPAKIK